MSIEVCPRCTCRFAVGLLRCPQCGEVAPLFADRTTTEEDQMPRITVGAGPTNAAAQPGDPGYIEPEAQPQAAEVQATPESEPEALVAEEAAPAAEPEPEAAPTDPEPAEQATETATNSKADSK
jgi:hypothetical protein